MFFAFICLMNLEILSNHPEASNWGFDDGNFHTNGEERMLNCLEPESIVFDVGANWGSWSLMALQKEPRLLLYSFEPLPQKFKELTNNVNSPFLYPFAFSNEVGKGLFYSLDGEESHLSGFFPRPHYGKRATPIQVDLESIDHFCASHNVNQIDYLKIDTEGGELKVLQGAKEMLFNHRIKALQFEYGGTYLDANITLKEVIQYLTKAGYLIFRISPRGIIPIAQWSESLENYRYANYFAIIQSELPQYALVKDLK